MMVEVPTTVAAQTCLFSFLKKVGMNNNLNDYNDCKVNKQKKKPTHNLLPKPNSTADPALERRPLTLAVAAKSIKFFFIKKRVKYNT
jgi:hypothetical protein